MHGGRWPRPGWQWRPSAGLESFAGRGMDGAFQDELLRLLSSLQMAKLKWSKIMSQSLKSHEIEQKKFEVFTFPISFLSCEGVAGSHFQAFFHNHKD